MLEIDYAFSYPPWHRDAACVGHPEVDWFRGRGESIKAERAVCQGCLVQKDCLGWAVDEGPKLIGLSGGTTARERNWLLDNGLTCALVAKWGTHALEGRRIEAWDAFESERYAEVVAELVTKAT